MTFMSDAWGRRVMGALNTGNGSHLKEALKDLDKFKLDFIIGNFSPLTKAVRRGQYDSVKQLLRAGASADFKNSFGFTPLMEASLQDKIDMCKLLLQHGADVNVVRNYGQATALHYAAQRGNHAIATLLLEYGAVIFDPSKPKDFGHQPIAAFATCHDTDTLEFLLGYCNRQGIEVPQHWLFDMCMHHHHEQCAFVVLNHGFYPLLDSKSCHIAADHGFIKLICVLIELNPQFLREQFETHLCFHRNHEKEFTDWLAEYRKHPPSLVKLCRSAILSQMGAYYTPKIDLLPLPTGLKTFLKVVQPAFNPK